MTMGQKIAQARKELGREWTQQKLAEACGKSRAWIAGIENDRFDVHADDLKLLAKVLKKPLEDLKSDTIDGASIVRDAVIPPPALPHGQQMMIVPVCGVVG